MIRQKTIHCGKGTKTYYREVDIIMYKNTPRQRGKKRKPSLPKQERLNFKNSVRHLNQICKANFNETVINPPAELGRLTDAGGGEQSIKIENSAV